MSETIIKDRYIFNKKINYSFITVNYRDRAPCYIRRAYLTKDEVDEFLINEYFQNLVLYENLRVFSEKDLDKEVVISLSDNSFEGMSLREYFFSSAYKSLPFDEINGELHMRWKHGYKEWFDSQTSQNQVSV